MNSCDMICPRPAADPAVARYVTRRRLWCFIAIAAFLGLTGTRTTAFAQLDETWTVTVNGQSVRVNPDGTFVISNITTADQFGVDGPGSSPDFLSDDIMRLTGTSTVGGTTRYVVNVTPFQITPGLSFDISELIIFETPLPFPGTIRITVDPDELMIGQSVALTVTGVLSDFSEVDVTERSTGTVYRTSNPVFASVGQNGLVTAHRLGTVFVTATNFGATAVKRIDVIGETRTTTVTGFVLSEIGSPIEGASVSTPFAAADATDSTGFFSSLQTVPVHTQVTATSSASIDGQLLSGMSIGVSVVPGGITDVGIITLTAPVERPLFDNPAYAVGTSPSSLVSGDLNGDGATDFVVTNQFDDTVSVLLNASNGLLAEAVEYNTGRSPVDVAIGDLDGDGDADLAVAHSPRRMSVLLNRGDGTFIDDLPSLPMAGFSEAIVVGDLDGDDDLDVVLAGKVEVDATDVSVVVVFMNNGDATFAPSVTFPVGTDPTSLAIGDLDGDGDLDLVTGNRRDDNVSVLLNNGSGGFAPHVVYTPGEAFSGRLVEVVLADIDGDEDLDVIVGINRFSFSEDDEVILLLNAGDATYTAGPAIPTLGSMTAINVGDIDRDGAIDVVASFSANSSGGVSVLINDGAGIGFTRFDAALGGAPLSVALADVDLDLDLDIFVADVTQGKVFSLENRGKNGFGPPTFDTGLTTNTSGIGASVVLIGDFDGVGDADLVVAGLGDTHVSVLTDNGSGGFNAPVLYAAPSRVNDVASGDFDGDNDFDLAVITADGGTAINQVTILTNAGDATFVELPGIDVAAGPRSVVAGHLNDDENLDLAVASSFRSSGTLSVLFGRGDGSFADAIQIPVNSPGKIIIADVNGDSANDLIVGQSARTLAVLINNGDGSFAAPFEVVTPASTTVMALADVDADGDVDAILRGGNQDCRLFMLPGPGGTFGEAVCLYTDRFLSFDALALDDVDGNGDVDIVVISRVSAAGYLAGNGDGTFQLPTIFSTGITPGSIAIGDIDGDGDTDLVAARDRTDPAGPPAVAVIRNRLLP